MGERPFWNLTVNILGLNATIVLLLQMWAFRRKEDIVVAFHDVHKE